MRSLGKSRSPNVRALAYAFVLLLAVPLIALAAPLSSSSLVGPTGVGPIVIGTTPVQAAKTGTHFSSTAPAPGSTCYYVRRAAPPGLSFMVEDGTIRRAEVTSSALRTVDDFRVGDALARLQRFFGSRAVLAPDKYDPHTRNLTVVPMGSAAAKYRMVYVVKDSQVSSTFAGALPQVLYVEGCS